MVYNSHIDAIHHSFPQNYQTLSVHPNMSKGKFLYAEVKTVLYRFIAGETFSRCAAEWRHIGKAFVHGGLSSTIVSTRKKAKFMQPSSE